MAAAGFTAAFTTIPGANGPRTDRYRLHRYEAHEFLAARLRLSSPSETPG